MIRKTIGKPPKHFITDGLPAYMKSSRKVFDKDTRHIHLRIDMNNNKMEGLMEKYGIVKKFIVV